MSVSEKKQERTKAKTAVKLAARRLISAANQETDFDSLKKLMVELEKFYDDFLLVNEEFESLVTIEANQEHSVVNGEDIVTYRENVKKSYMEAQEVFLDKRNEDKSRSMAVEAVRVALKLEVTSLADVIKVAEENLHSVSPNVSALQLDMVELQELSSSLNNKTSELSLFNSSKLEQDILLTEEISCILGKSRSQVRAIKLRLHECQNSDHPPQSLEPSDTTLHQDISHNNKPGSESVIINGSSSTDTITINSGNLMSVSAPIFTPSSQPTTIASSQDNPTSSNHVVQTQTNNIPALASSTIHHTTISQPLFSNPVLQSQPQPPISYFPSTTMSPPHITTPSYNPISSHPITTYYTQPLHSAQSTSVHPHSLNQFGSFSHPSVVTQSSLLYPPNTPSNNIAYTRSSDPVQLRKMELPTFNGRRRDWPEFKTVWKSVAESSFRNKTALAHELKRSVRGEASKRIRSVYITKPEAYDVMWSKLESYYEDVGASVQAALDDLHKLKPVVEEDFRGLVELIDEVESAYSQLRELGNLNVLTMRDVDQITDLLPNNLKVEWRRRYRDMMPTEKVRPFESFMKFLDSERDAVSRMAENQPKARFKKTTHHTDRLGVKKFYKCAFPSHRKDGINHTTEECKEFLKLSVSGKNGKYQLLKEVNACFKCFGNHQRLDCPSKERCSCGSDRHHKLLCEAKTKPERSSKEETKVEKKESHTVQSDALSLYPIYQVPVSGCKKTVTVFCDGGSNATYITHRAAERIKAKKLGKVTLDVTTMGNIERTHHTEQYEFTVTTSTGKRVTITAYGMERITGPVNELDPDVLKKLLPDYDPISLQRKSSVVDVLLGCDYFGLHPKHEETKCGENLSVMSGELGTCLQGTHPELFERTKRDSNLAKVIHDVRDKVQTFRVQAEAHPEFLPIQSCFKKGVHLTQDKRQEHSVQNFIVGEELGTEVTPRCGGCKCGKCPTVGHTYSFKEEQELNIIRKNLEYDEAQQCWITSYPWTVDPNSLPDNYDGALATLKRTESTLIKDLTWARKYEEQIQDMVDRKVARKLKPDDIREWNGPVYYISHLAVQNPKSNSTPVRIVFNSSQVFNGVSLNSCLAKGPDSYMNNQIGILLRWREQEVALVGDIRKMFNSVLLKDLEKHCHRFLWRNLELERPPDIYIMECVNMGDKPAPAISTEAIYMTANRFAEDSPDAAELIKKSTYVDDLIDSRATMDDALKVGQETEKMLKKGGFSVKCWQLSREDRPRASLTRKASSVQKLEKTNDVVNMLKGTKSTVRVLGVGWDPVADCLVYEVVINFSKKKRGVRTGPNLKVDDLPNSIPEVLTKRTVLEQVMKIYDPLGLVCPFTLWGKIYLRELWSLKLDWDTPLPAHLAAKWIKFFTTLFQLEKLRFPRCLQPKNAVGRPWLIILSDGSDLAYGYAAYIRWSLLDGTFWCRLIMAKCRIAPLNKISTPQMELNAAVLSKRGRKVIETEMRIEFERVLQLVDSDTVLSMINKTSTRFRVYEGVRVGEIQAATNGDLSCWAWMSGNENIADWLTRGREPSQLGDDSEWWNGPSILYQPIESWGLKFGSQKSDELPGEKKIRTSNLVETQVELIDVSRFSSFNKIVWVIGRIIGMLRCKTFKGGTTTKLTPQLFRDAEDYLVRMAQKELDEEIRKKDTKGRTGGRYKSLNPTKDQDGYYVVGQRLKAKNPMTPDAALQKLLPTHHRLTRLLMDRAHRQGGHRGRDATLARFREKYWTAYGSKIAQSTKSKCQLCKLRDIKLGEQEMGGLPESRLKPAPPFTYVMLDLFGPYDVRGEVQKRTTGKAYGVIFTDMVSRAVHIEAVYGYDTGSFLLALSRFASVRGWPQYIYSDPGSQLIGAERELKETWEKIDRSELTKTGVQNGLKWIFGAADSPWYQGAVESLVKAAKRAIHFAVGKKRLTVPEFLTVCTEAANLLNERPIGTLPSADSELNVLTPNTLLLGRSTAKNPGGWQPFVYNQSAQNRYHLVQTAVEDFWEKWTQLYAPTLIVQRKWHVSRRNLRVGDVVIVADRNVLRGEYRLGIIKEVYPDCDGKVRRVLVTYKNFRAGKNFQCYGKSEAVTVSRSVQRLALLVPNEEK